MSKIVFKFFWSLKNIVRRNHYKHHEPNIEVSGLFKIVYDKGRDQSAHSKHPMTNLDVKLAIFSCVGSKDWDVEYNLSHSAEYWG